MIFAQPRSGSSSLKEIISSQEIPILGEPFNVDVTQEYLQKIKKEKFQDILNEIKQKYLGLKHLFFQLEYKKNIILLENYRTVFLYRENILEASLSVQMAIQTKKWAASDVNYQSDYHKIKHININQVLETCKELHSFNKLYNEKIKKNLIIKYEDLYQNDEEKQMDMIKFIFDFLKIKIKDKEKIKFFCDKKNKLNKEKWSEIIENYNEILEAYDKRKNKFSTCL
jgi:LPS sulfotransferase NodH